MKQRRRLRDYTADIKQKNTKISELSSELEGKQAAFDDYKSVNDKKIKVRNEDISIVWVNILLCSRGLLDSLSCFQGSTAIRLGYL